MSRKLFSSNDYCKQLIKDIPQPPNLFEMDCFADVRTAGSYRENEWTERLFHCLVFNKIEAELTAPYTAHQIQKSWKTRIPKGIDNRCLLFQGTPDMIIKCRNEGILNLKVKHQEDVEQQEDMHQGIVHQIVHQRVADFRWGIR